ncbi:MAG TPA: 4Fe-4S dicluster domain-containing protein [Candidatus Dormibacteraeota bacterium]|nr:4Fe-4S dicluster domain-containing protein [Candidatus Dormibacteraeota bacterium]
MLDQSRCIGCHACTTACKSENAVPLGVTRTYVKSVEVGSFPRARRAFQVTRCNQCEDAPCVEACPTGAMYRRPDGIVDFDKSICIGCKACMAACPYDAIFINPEDHSAEKCNFCAHRLDQGLEPACVVVCPTEAILVGDLDDPTSKVAQIVGRESVQVRRPEKATSPKVFYRGAHQATLDPLAARRPGGGLFMWSQQSGEVVSGAPAGAANSSAAALLAYDVAHARPWGWRVGLYTWTKSLAAGVYLVALSLLLAGRLPAPNPLWGWGSPLLAGVFLALTGLLLIWDLKHPFRFHLIFIRPQWRSWLVRGAFVIGAYGLLLAADLGAGLGGLAAIQLVLIAPGLPLAALAAVYTGFLFAQARGRDLWQSPLLPAHLLVQAFLAGSAGLLPLALWLAPGTTAALALVLAGSALAHLLLVVAETTLPHPTAQARLAGHDLLRGGSALFFWTGVALVAIAVTAPWTGPWTFAPTLAGLAAYEHAYVRAGQSVPLA